MSKSQNDKKNIALIGTGVSGLSCLYFYLKNKSKNVDRVDVFEQHDKIGGVLVNVQRDGFTLEHGAQGVLSSRTNFMHLVEELNLQKSISAIKSDKAHRHLFFKNQIIALSPKNIFLMFRTKLISFFSCLRILCEIFIRRSSNQNETVNEFFTRRFGQTFSRHFLMPVMKGIWGGGASRILLRFAFPQLKQIEQDHGSVVKYFLKQARSKNKIKKELISFETGMKCLPNALLNAVQNICLENKIQFRLNLNSSFVCSADQSYDVIIYSGQPWKEKSDFDLKKLSFSLNLRQNSDEYFQKIHNAWNVLRNIPTHSLCVVGIGGKNADVRTRLDGFGALAVENNDEGVLGVICVHSLNPAHVPADSFLYRVILGGENAPKNMNFETCLDAEIIHCAKRYLQKYHLLHPEQTYVFEHVVRHQRYLPLPTEYHDKILSAVAELEQSIPGLYFTGNYLLGPAVDSCIEYSKVVADRIK